MSLFLLVPEDQKGLTALLPVVGGDERLALGSWNEVLATLREVAGGEAALLRNWSLYEACQPDDERVMMIAEGVSEQLRPDGEAVLDLDARMITLAELQTVAHGLGLSVGFVAVLKKPGGDPPPLVERLDLELVEALRHLGMASTGQVAKYLGSKKTLTIRKRLQLLARFRRVIMTGERGGVRYSLPVEVEP